MKPGEVDGMMRQQVSPKPGQEMLAELLMAQAEPVTLVITGQGGMGEKCWKIDTKSGHVPT
jgi:hypothetical protein